jgi:subtilisin family serine protease
VILVASAGNYAQDVALYPAAYDGVLSVGSVDPNLTRSDFSHYGATVDVYAPGRDILTTSVTGDYEMQTGTSFSAPLVSALTAIQQDISSPLATGDNDIAFVPSPGINPCE